VTIRRNPECDKQFHGTLRSNRRDTGAVGRVVFVSRDFASRERNATFYLVEHTEDGRHETAAYKVSEVEHAPTPTDRDYSIAGLTDAGVTLGNGTVLHWDELAVLVHQLDHDTIQKTGYDGHSAKIAAQAAATFAAHLDLMWKQHLANVAANQQNEPNRPNTANSADGAS
jgi:hypothetical protein